MNNLREDIFFKCVCIAEGGKVEEEEMLYYMCLPASIAWRRPLVVLYVCTNTIAWCGYILHAR